ncbi:MAG: aminomethyl-transferring glycine dehydrogenase subunit GcvPA [Pseudomonadota bacterium]
MRYLPHTDADVRRMLDVIGAESLDALFASIPAAQRLTGALDLPPALSERELRKHLSALGGAPAPQTLVGAGAYLHHVPSLVDHLISRAEWYSAYTPYQPEVSQGTLQAIFEYQTLITQLTGLEVSNASMYDGATACAEAVLMAQRLTREARTRVLVSAGLHPEYRDVLTTYLAATALTVEIVPVDGHGAMDQHALGNLLDATVLVVVPQTPNFFGVVEDPAPVAKASHQAGALVAVAVPEPVALGLMQAPGTAGADIVFGEGLGLTGALSFGGPGFGFFACRRDHMRQMPGRLAGATVDRRGERGFVLTLSTREQHIRREKATSNICTNQGLMALAGSIALSLLGPRGLAELARHNLAKAEHAKRRARGAGLRLVYDGPTFNEFLLDIGPDATDRLAKLERRGIVGGLDLGRFDPARQGQVLVCTTELHERSLIDLVVDGLAGRAQPL